MKLDERIDQICKDLGAYVGEAHLSKIESACYAAILAFCEQEPSERQKGMIREAMTDFMAAITGMKPPAEAESFPPEIAIAMEGIILRWSHAMRDTQIKEMFGEKKS